MTGSGNVYLAGSFNGIVDFDPGPKTKYVSAGQIANKISEAGFVLKLDTNGKFGWVSPFVGQVVGANKGYAYANSVALDTSGNIVVGGSYRDTVDFNPGSGTTTLPALGGAFITKLNSSGGLVWARALVRSESSGTVTVGGLNVDSAGAIYATGGYRGTVDFDPGAGTVTQTSVEAGPSAGDIYVVKLSAAGSLSWVETFGGEGIGDFGSGIAVDPIGVIHVAGQFEGSVDFDPDPLATFSLIPGSYRKGFRLRLRQA